MQQQGDFFLALDRRPDGARASDGAVSRARRDQPNAGHPGRATPRSAGHGLSMSTAAVDDIAKPGPPDPPAGASPERAAQMRVECMRTMFRQIPNSFVAAMGVTVYMVVTMWNHVPPRLI